MQHNKKIGECCLLAVACLLLLMDCAVVVVVVKNKFDAFDRQQTDFIWYVFYKRVSRIHVLLS